MTNIKSLADQLRERLRAGPDAPKQPEAPAVLPDGVPAILANIAAHRTTGADKLLIRLDPRTTFLLKQLKVSAGIDMVQFVSYAVQQVLDGHPELLEYIKQQSLHRF